MTEEPRWYVAHTYSGYENKVASSIEKAVENRRLQDLIFAVSVPTEKVTEYKDEKPVEVERKIFPGYVLVKMIMTDDSWHVVRNTRGCTGFVGPGSKPVPLTDSEVAALGIERREIINVDFAVGDNVRITAGPLANFVGIVDELDTEHNRVRVTVSMFGRETPVELELGQLPHDPR